MNQCPHCGAHREMIWNAGHLVWVCPQERDGLGFHPGQRTTNNTSDGGSSKADPLVPMWVNK